MDMGLSIVEDTAWLIDMGLSIVDTACLVDMGLSIVDTGYGG